MQRDIAGMANRRAAKYERQAQSLSWDLRDSKLKIPPDAAMAVAKAADQLKAAAALLRKKEDA